MRFEIIEHLVDLMFYESRHAQILILSMVNPNSSSLPLQVLCTKTMVSCVAPEGKTML